MRVLPLGGSLLLPVALCLSEAVANASIVSHYASFYLGFLNWPCEKAEMQLSIQAGKLNLTESRYDLIKNNRQVSFRATAGRSLDNLQPLRLQEEETQEFSFETTSH